MTATDAIGDAIDELIHAGGPRPADRLGSMLDRLWGRFVRVPAPLLVGGLVLLLVARSGVALGRSDLRAVLVITEAFPTPVLDWRANSVLPYGLAHFIGVSEPWQWWALHGVVIAAAVAVAAACIRRRFDSPGARRTAALWLTVGSVPPVLLQRVGSYDPFTVIGALLIVLGGRVGLAVGGGVLIGLTSAEQGALGVAAGVAMLAVLRAHDTGSVRLLGDPRRAPLFRQLALGAGGILLARLSVLAWFAAQGAAVPSRFSVLDQYLGDSVRNAVAGGGAGVYAWFGLGWLIALLGWLVGRWGRTTFLGVVACLTLPAAAAMAITLDGTRVFVMVSLPAFLVLLAWVVDRIDRAPALDAQLARRIAMVALLLAPLVPALIAEPSGAPHFVFPWGR